MPGNGPTVRWIRTQRLLSCTLAAKTFAGSSVNELPLRDLPGEEVEGM